MTKIYELNNHEKIQQYLKTYPTLKYITINDIKVSMIYQINLERYLINHNVFPSTTQKIQTLITYDTISIYTNIK